MIKISYYKLIDLISLLSKHVMFLRTDNTVKHMRVCRKPIDQVQHYYLSESRFFRSVVELITYYEKTSLSENFEG